MFKVHVVGMTCEFMLNISILENYPRLLFDTMFVGNDTFINFCIFSRVQVFTKKLAKVVTFFIWV